MREPRAWDEEYLLALPVGEFDWLEVKERRALDLTLPNVKESDVRENLSKAVSAFANSGGGVIVLGLSNPQRVWKVSDGGVELNVKRPSTREWLEDIIPTLVDVPLRSFNVYVVQGQGDASQIATGRGVFVVEIPDSDQAPHQATDNRYYVRVGGKSRPIGHRLVLDILGRRQHPTIDLEFEIRAGTYVEQQLLAGLASRSARETKRRFELVITATNQGRVLARFVNCFVRVPVVLIPELERKYQSKDADFEEIDGTWYVEWSRRNTRRDVVKAEVLGPSEYGASWFDPILPGLSYTWEWDLREDFDQVKLGGERVIWEVYADNAPKQSGTVLVRDIEVTGKTGE